MELQVKLVSGQQVIEYNSNLFLKPKGIYWCAFLKSPKVYGIRLDLF
jgi:hypothetical protein